MAIDIDARSSEQVYHGSVGRGFSSTIRVDFSKYPGVNTNVIALFNIPAGTRVQGALVNVLTAQGNTCTADLGDHTPEGDAVDIDGLGAAYNLNSLGLQQKDNAAYPAAGGKTYIAESVLTMTLKHTTNKAVIDVTIFGFLPPL